MIIKLSFLKSKGLTLYPFIFVGEKDECLIAHEEVHLIQQKGNLMQWLFKYLTDKDFRWQEEKEAHTVQFGCIKSKGRAINKDYWLNLITKNYGVDTEKVKEFLSGF